MCERHCSDVGLGLNGFLKGLPERHLDGMLGEWFLRVLALPPGLVFRFRFGFWRMVSARDCDLGLEGWFLLVV